MTRARGWILAVACATFCLPAFVGTAGAAVPRHLIGMNVDGVALAPGIDVGYHLRAIREAGAGSVRWSIDWSAIQPYRSWDEVPDERRRDFTDVDGAPMDFRATDRFVAVAAQVRLRLLPVINTAAPWASENPFVAFAPPADIAAFGRFAGVLASATGARATSGPASRAAAPAADAWQIWNEPAGLDGFDSPSEFWQSERDSLPTTSRCSGRRDGLEADPRSRSCSAVRQVLDLARPALRAGPARCSTRSPSTRTRASRERGADRQVRAEGDGRERGQAARAHEVSYAPPDAADSRVSVQGPRRSALARGTSSRAGLLVHVDVDRTATPCGS